MLVHIINHAYNCIVSYSYCNMYVALCITTYGSYVATWPYFHTHDHANYNIVITIVTTNHDLYLMVATNIWCCLHSIPS